MNEQTDKPQTKKDAAEGTQPSSSQQPQQGKGTQGGRQSSSAMQSHEEQRGHQRDLQTNGEQGREQQGMTRRDWFAPSSWAENPFAMMRRFTEEMDRMMDRLREDFGFGRGWLGSRFGAGREFGQGMWSPRIEVCERDNQLIICADLPGLKREDVHVEFSNDALTIQGERRQDHEETHEGHRTSERSYGRFYRSIPLPEGIDPENAKATFQDGELRIMMPMPQREAPRSRRIEIQGAEGKQSRAQS